MFDRKCKIIFIRHGATIYTEQNRLYDLDDYPPLNEKGKEEMEKLAYWLKVSNQSADLIYCSAALRAIQSTRYIAKTLKREFNVLDEVYERRAGIWGGLTFKQIGEKYPSMLNEYHNDPSSFWPEGGESTLALYERVKKAIDQLVIENQHKRILVVTHAGVIQAAISAAIGIPPEYHARIYIPTGSATQINYYTGWSSLVYSGYLPV